MVLNQGVCREKNCINLSHVNMTNLQQKAAFAIPSEISSSCRKKKFVVLQLKTLEQKLRINKEIAILNGSCLHYHPQTIFSVAFIFLTA